jgi:hypothetical protein
MRSSRGIVAAGFVFICPAECIAIPPKSDEARETGQLPEIRSGEYHGLSRQSCIKQWLE